MSDSLQKAQNLHPKGINIASSIVTHREATGDKSVTLDRHEKAVLCELIPEEQIARRGGGTTHTGSSEKTFMIWNQKQNTFLEGKLALTKPKHQGNETRLYFKRDAANNLAIKNLVPFYPNAGDLFFVLRVQDDPRPYIGHMAETVFNGLTSKNAAIKSFTKGLNLDLFDDEYQKAVHEPTVPASSKTKTSTDHGRKASIGKKAISDSKHECQNDPQHETFISGSDGKPYMEPHHLIPISQQSNFPTASLDCAANIVVLCPTCHRAIHYGEASIKKEMVKKFFNERTANLKKAGKSETLDELYEKYGVE